MAEIQRSLPVNNIQGERDHVAKQIQAARKHERDFFHYTTGRGIHQYMAAFLGLRCAMEYVRSLDPAYRKVLDVGSGEMKGIRDFPKFTMGEGIHYYATALRRTDITPSHEKNLTTHLTSVEVLRDIPDGGIGAVIALHSLAYSSSPRLAIGRINEVLTPNGILKATFLAKTVDDSIVFRRDSFKTYDAFVSPLKELGYDIAIHRRTDMENSDADIIVALKPGGEKKTSAQELLDNDKNDFENYLSTIKSNQHYVIGQINKSQNGKASISGMNTPVVDYREWHAHALSRALYMKIEA